ncbi:MAG TPA: rRNA adenine N-6-methyltransferase family protein, partial [Phycisphaerae bacterium]|nr:rRNA adenine N-6-methyltransferase family protein [Phycisphaerae bacterium]
MQTLREIRQMLDAEGLAPHKRFGQSFLVDLNLMRKLLELADLEGSETVLEVGAGTGSLTEELLDRAR